MAQANNSNQESTKKALSLVLFSTAVLSFMCYIPGLLGVDLELKGGAIEESLSSSIVKMAAVAAIATTSPLLVDFGVDIIFRSTNIYDRSDRIGLIVALQAPALLLLIDLFENPGDLYVASYYFQYLLGLGALFSMLRKYNPKLISVRFLCTVFTFLFLISISALVPFKSANTIHLFAIVIFHIIIFFKAIHFYYIFYKNWMVSTLNFFEFYNSSTYETTMSFTIFSSVSFYSIISLLEPYIVQNTGTWRDTSILFILIHLIDQTIFTLLINGLPGTARAHSIKLHEKLEQKKTFVRYLSHEIRTPLNTLSMGLDLLKSKMKKSRFSQRDEMNDNIDSLQLSCKAAVEILTEILDYEKLDSGLATTNKSYVYPMSFLREVILPFAVAAQQKEVNMIIDECSSASIAAFALHIDIRKISQVLRNIVSNAIKFTNANGDITISIHVVDAPDFRPSFGFLSWFSHSQNQQRIVVSADSLIPKIIRVTVKDSGFGIAKENIGRLFNEIIQFEAHSQQNGGGSGLGLWISKKIVQMHGGAISAYSAGLGHGCTFILDLRLTSLLDVPIGELQPISVSNLEDHPQRRIGIDMPMISPQSLDHNCILEDDDDEASEPNQVSRAPLHILIVDDSSPTRKIMRRTFEHINFSCVEAADGFIAISAFKAEIEVGRYFDAILLDNCMPNMDGPECCRQLRALGYSGVIFGVTGHVLTEDVENFNSAGVDKVLLKPITLDLFIKEFDMIESSKTLV